ncbi:MAG: RluA family pseudouridine synthase [Clostridia bacterium]|nr:RluA family pseudouridine synthase [Clostridia bacterium]
MNINIVYEDDDIIVCQKPIGVSSQYSDKENMLSLLKDQLDLKELPYVIHRLDTAVGGLMVYSKNKKSASFLSRQVSDSQFTKKYYCVIHSKPENNTDTLTDYLFKDSRKNKSFVVKKERKGVKFASLEYELIDSVEYKDETLSLLKITLHTGRSHQIRVQFSSRKMPLYGDGKYGGSDNCNIALFSCELGFKNQDDEIINYKLKPEGFPWNLFDF